MAPVRVPTRRQVDLSLLAGWALCEEFSNRGCSVFAASRSLEKMEGLAREEEEGQGSVTLIKLDVNSEESVKEVSWSS